MTQNAAQNQLIEVSVKNKHRNCSHSTIIISYTVLYQFDMPIEENFSEKTIQIGLL